MPLIDLLFKQKVRFGVGASEEFLPYGAVELDASIEETHAHANDITQYPVEEGVDITDHVRQQPDRVTLRGIVTDHPLTHGGTLGLSGRSLDAYGKALYMLANGELITVVTTLNTYHDMVIESMEVPRNSQRGQAVEMTLSLRQIKKAQVAVAAGTSDLGTQNTTTVN